ncbi:MAG: hypothetical protein N3C59_01470 [Azovibrio sp.]|nr:hypothetical protein [Azovibrio sp.]
MLELSDEQKLQLLLVGGPIVSLLGTWMSLRTYGRLKQRTAQRRQEAESAAPAAPRDEGRA